MENLHKFYLNDNYFVLDINSGSVHVVDEIVYDIVEDYESKSRDEIFKVYGEKYSEDDLNKAMSEIDDLRNEGLIYTPCPIEKMRTYNPQNIIKAMCLHVAHDCKRNTESASDLQSLQTA